MPVQTPRFEIYTDEQQLRSYVSAPPRHKPLSQREAARVACRVIHARGVQPSPGRVQLALEQPVTHDLNGEMSKGYAEAMAELGYVRVRIGDGIFGVNRWRRAV